MRLDLNSGPCIALIEPSQLICTCTYLSTYVDQLVECIKNIVIFFTVHVHTHNMHSTHTYMNTRIYVYTYSGVLPIPIIRVQVILQSGLAPVGQPRQELAHYVSILGLLVTLERVEVAAEVSHELQVGLTVTKVGQRELRRVREGGREGERGEEKEKEGRRGRDRGGEGQTGEEREREGRKGRESGGEGRRRKERGEEGERGAERKKGERGQGREVKQPGEREKRE